MRVLVTGSRHWKDRTSIRTALTAYRQPGAVLVSGACPTGADALAEGIWREWGLTVERHPADWLRHGKAAGPIRNQQMVDAGADVCLAFPLPDSRGTQDCIRKAQAAGIPCIVSRRPTWQ